MQPPRIVVKADNLIERSVPVRVAVGSSLSNGALTVENVSVTPANVTLRGPEAMVEDIASVPVPIQADPKAAGSTMQQVVTLDTPGLVTPIPPTVKVQYSITSGRAEVTRSCKVEVLAENRQFTVTPAEVSVHIEVPEALVKNAQYLKQLEATVSPPDMAEGESRKVEIRFRLPEGMTLLNPGTEVTISRKKNSPASRRVAGLEAAAAIRNGMADRLFGTDGLRGTVNNYPMTVDVALRLGLAAGVRFRQGAASAQGGYRQGYAAFGLYVRISPHCRSVRGGYAGHHDRAAADARHIFSHAQHAGRPWRGYLGFAQSLSRQRHQVFDADGYKLPDLAEDEISAMVLDEGFPGPIPIAVVWAGASRSRTPAAGTSCIPRAVFRRI